MKSKQLVALTLSSALSLSATCAYAGDREELESLRETTRALTQILLEKGLIAPDKAEQLLKQAAAPAPADTPAPVDPKSIRVQYVPEAMKKEMRDQIKTEVLAQAKTERWGEPGALPDWLKRISWEGDIRLRLQQDLFPNTDPANVPAAVAQLNGLNINNTTDDRSRLRVRARLGMQAKISDSITAGMRLTTGGTGSGSDPVSTNQTLGNYGTRYTLGLDRAFVSYSPKPWLLLTGGRIANPFFMSTDLVWSENINFEGVAVRLRPTFNDNAKGFFTIGAFPIQDIEPTPTSDATSKWLYGYQAGLDLGFGKANSARISLGLFDFHNTEGIRNPVLDTHTYDQTAPAFRQRGNSVFNIANSTDPNVTLFGLASKFREINLSTSIDLANFDPVHVLLDADFVRNIGFDHAEILARTGLDLEENTNGYQGKITVGMPKLKKPGDWQGFVGYRYVGADAVLDAFTDSDFHLGGTNTQGYFLGARYAFEQNTSVSGRWMSAKEITGWPLSIDVFQLDLNTSF